METATPLGKGRAGSTRAIHRWLFSAVALVVLSFLAAFGMLRLAHARQIEATRQGFFLYSSADGPALDLAHSLRDRTGIAGYDLEAPSTRRHLRDLDLAWEGKDAALLLPSPAGWVQIRDEKTIEEALQPLAGVPTPHLRGAFAALALAAVWVLFTFWRSQMAYLGAAWPALGIGAIGLATPLCSGCLAGSDGLTPMASLAGLGGFVALLLLLALRNRAPQFALSTIAVISVAAGIGQAILLTNQPKFCPGCLLAGVAFAGSFSLASVTLGERRVRAILFGRTAGAAVTLAGVLFGFRHAQSALTRLEPKPQADSDSVVGRTLPSYVRTAKPLGKGLYIISLAKCGACDLAKADLRRRGIPFRDIPYCSILQTNECFKADFPEVSPLFLFCDSKGKILHAEAGWTDAPYELARFNERTQRWIGQLK